MLGKDAGAFVDGVVLDAMRADHISGVSVSIVQNGQVLLATGYGLASRGPDRPVTEDTLFRMGSSSKTFTWIALMREVEKARVRLDAPVNTYLPPAARFPEGRFTRPILVRDLMSHSAGLEDLAFGHLFPKTPASTKTLEEYVVTEQPQRVREPGGPPSYCNYCAVLAGYIVARLEGIDFETLIERDITGPLGMTSTSFRDAVQAHRGLPAPMTARQAHALSQGFEWSGTEFEAKPNESFVQAAPAGGAATSANDMARYMLMLLNDGRLDKATIFGPETARAFRTPILHTEPGISGWDHGFMQFPLPGGFTGYGHGGDTTLFHTQIVLVPALRLGVFVSTNTDSGVRLARRLPELLIQRFYGGRNPALSAPAKIDAGLLEPYVGTWIGMRRTTRGVEGFIDLLAQSASTSASPQGLVTDNGITWVPDGPAGRFRQRDGVRVMSFDFKDGRPVRWRTELNVDQNERTVAWEGQTPLVALGGLTLLSAFATLGGFFVRRRDLPKSRFQSVAGMIQAGAALGWTASITALGAWLANADDNYTALMGWPGPFITTFVWAGALAALLSLVCMALALAVWRGEGWTRWRKMRWSMTTAIFLGYAGLVFIRGGLDVFSI